MILSMMMVAILTVTNMSGAYQAASVVCAAEDGNAGSEEKQEETDCGECANFDFASVLHRVVSIQLSVVSIQLIISRT